MLVGVFADNLNEDEEGFGVLVVLVPEGLGGLLEDVGVGCASGQYPPRSDEIAATHG